MVIENWQEIKKWLEKNYFLDEHLNHDFRFMFVIYTILERDLVSQITKLTLKTYHKYYNETNYEKIKYSAFERSIYRIADRIAFPQESIKGLLSRIITEIQLEL